MIEYAFHPEALSDLDEVWEYIAADNLDAADRVIGEIVSAIRAVALSPGIGHRRLDLTSRPLRFITVRQYLIAYASDRGTIWVIAVIHGRRNPRVLAAILRGRE